MSTGSRQTWFATLRRDSGLFAVAGALVMLLNIVQPLLAAQASDAGHWVICTVYGPEKPIEASDLPAAMSDKCPICLAGNACAGAPAYKAALSSDPAFPAPAALTAAPLHVEERGPVTPGPTGPPPAIRAPPLSA